MPVYLPPRRGISHSQALAEARVYATADDPELLTLALYHSAFKAPVYVVCDYQDLVATIEADAPADAGLTVRFKALPLRVTLPEETDTNRSPTAQIELDNVMRQLSPYLRLAAASREPVVLIARTYLASDTSAPHDMPPLRLELTSASTDGTNVAVQAGYGDIVNFPFPALSYQPEDFPGLAAAQ